MEWEKAKNMIIVFFLALNLVLSGFIYATQRKYILSAERDKVIFEILSENNINLYCSIDKKFSPMKKMALENYKMTEKAMLELFFRDNESIYKSIKEERIEYINENEFLYMGPTGTDFFYEYYGEGPLLEMNMDIAKELSQEFMKGLGDIGKNFVLEIPPYYSGDTIVVEYRQNYKGYKIFNNYIKFEINEMGIIRILFSYFEPKGLVESQRDICPPDEALFTFMKFVQNREGINQSSIIIDKIEIVYKLKSSGDDDLNAVPCYHIYYLFYDGDTMKRDDCTIDAYTNAVL